MLHITDLERLRCTVWKFWSFFTIWVVFDRWTQKIRSNIMCQYFHFSRTRLTMHLAEILSVFDRNIEKWLLCNHWREVGYRNARRWRRRYRFFVCYRVWQRRTGLKTVASGGWITKTYTPKTVSVRASTICVADLSATTWKDTCIFTIRTFSYS